MLFGLVSASVVAAGGEGVLASAGATRPVVIEFKDGRRLSASLEGVGCSRAMCSRVGLRARQRGAAVTRTAFDAIARIVTVDSGDAELFLDDGTSHPVTIVDDNRVFYVRAENQTRKVRLADVSAIRFAARTPWGDPDLQGTWSGVESLAVPMEREATLGTRNTLTEQEFNARRARMVASAASAGIEATNFGVEPDTSRSTSRQASLVIDPADGRRPMRVPEAEARRPDRTSFVPGPVNSISDLGLLDRCIAWTAVPAASPFNTLQIVQAPGYVALRSEMIHEARVIPLDRRSRGGAQLASYSGDSSGRWDGATLVVETAHMNGRVSLSGNEARLTDQAKVTERFALLASGTLWYEATVDDPGTWTRPWTLGFQRTRETSDTLFEYACHEGNYGVAYILSASRAAEKGPR
jgi:hypothetical protein